jgi:hypothetical protein
MVSNVPIGGNRAIFGMQASPQVQQAKQQLLQGSADPDLSDQQHHRPQQKERTTG